VGSFQPPIQVTQPPTRVTKKVAVFTVDKRDMPDPQ